MTSELAALPGPALGNEDKLHALGREASDEEQLKPMVRSLRERRPDQRLDERST
jgi:hypothetical protein